MGYKWGVADGSKHPFFHPTFDAKRCLKDTTFAPKRGVKVVSRPVTYPPYIPHTYPIGEPCRLCSRVPKAPAKPRSTLQWSSSAAQWQPMTTPKAAQGQPKGSPNARLWRARFAAAMAAAPRYSGRGSMPRPERLSLLN